MTYNEPKGSIGVFTRTLGPRTTATHASESSTAICKISSSHGQDGLEIVTVAQEIHFQLGLPSTEDERMRKIQSDTSKTVLSAPQSLYSDVRDTPGTSHPPNSAERSGAKAGIEQRFANDTEVISSAFIQGFPRLERRKPPSHCVDLLCPWQGYGETNDCLYPGQCTRKNRCKRALGCKRNSVWCEEYCRREGAYGSTKDKKQKHTHHQGLPSDDECLRVMCPVFERNTPPILSREDMEIERKCEISNGCDQSTEWCRTYCRCVRNDRACHAGTGNA